MKNSIIKDENGKFYYGWVIVIATGLVIGFVYNGVASFSGLFTLPVTEDLGFSIGGFSLWYTIMAFVSMICLLLFSKYFDEKNIKKVMIIGGVLTTISFIGFAVSNELWMFYAFAVLQGVGFATMCMTPCQVLISNWFGEKLRGRAMTIFIAFMSIMYSILANVINYILLNYGWRMAYTLLAVCTFVSLLIIMKFVVWSPEQKGIKRLGGLDAAEGEADKLLHTGVDFKEAIKKPMTWLAFISCGLAVLGSSSVLVHGIPTMQMCGMSPTIAVQILSILTIIMTFMGPVIGYINDKLGVPVVTIGTAVSFTIGMFGLSLMYENLILGTVLFFVGYLLGIGCINIVSPLLMGYMFGEKDLAKFLGYINIFISLGAAFASAMTGGLYEVFGGYQIPWLIITGIMVVVTVIRTVCSSKSRHYTANS